MGVIITLNQYSSRAISDIHAFPIEPNGTMKRFLVEDFIVCGWYQYLGIPHSVAVRGPLESTCLQMCV